MIWRQRYRDRIVENPALPPLTAVCLADGGVKSFPAQEVTLGAFSESGAMELAMWRKLVGEVTPGPVLSLWLGVSHSFAESSTPPSLHRFSYLSQDSSWSEALAQEGGEASFAIFTDRQGRRLAFRGLPTEDGLDGLQAFVNG